MTVTAVPVGALWVFVGIVSGAGGWSVVSAVGACGVVVLVGTMGRCAWLGSGERGAWWLWLWPCVLRDAWCVCGGGCLRWV